MSAQQPALHLGRVLVLLAATGSLVAVACSLAAAPIRRLATAAVRPVTFAEVLEGAAALTAMACAGWLFAAGVVVCGEALHARTAPVPRRATWLRPACMRRVVVAGGGAALGATLLSGPAGSVPAAPGPGVLPAVAASPVAGLPVPDRPTGVRLRTAPETARTSVGAGTVDRYTVAPGDSLWLIAARLLPPRSGAAEIAAAGRHLYSANRDRVGPDMDLIFPGTTLHVPAPLISGKDRP